MKTCINTRVKNTQSYILSGAISIISLHFMLCLSVCALLLAVSVYRKKNILDPCYNQFNVHLSISIADRAVKFEGFSQIPNDEN